ncbi:hypothetical protein JOE59_003294 [Agromyces cerinus]|uniref:hypothetical protein n=1 Tax=Agromyces cerinus TaxID=33878 RepID=UPI001958D5F6|nr:hypothetical protein [Agromyces cerinus]MBM7832589.1 hypothetical protein [Agromyces cerinus]
MGIFTRAEAAPTEPPLYPGLAGLESADAGELATQLFLRVFAVGQSSHVRPEACSAHCSGSRASTRCPA